MKKLNDKNLENRLSKWIGYGQLDSDFWFIGMEELGTDSIDEQELRISLPPVSDFVEFTSQLNRLVDGSWFDANQKLQKIYASLIRLYLCAMGLSGYKHPVNGDDTKKLTEKANKFLEEKFCKTSTLMLLTYLKPLPGNSQWNYNKLSDREDLLTNDKYLETWLPNRKKLLRELIHKYQPKIIVAYGKTNWKDFKELVDDDFFEPIIGGFAESNGKMVLIPHTSRASMKKLEELGYWIRKKML